MFFKGEENRKEPDLELKELDSRFAKSINDSKNKGAIRNRRAQTRGIKRMGEFTNGETPEQIASNDRSHVDAGEVETDVKGVFADGEKQDLFVFNVSKDEFNQNMSFGRKRIRFKTGSPVQQYMQGTKYVRPFWISYAESNGKKYLRKVK